MKKIIVAIDAVTYNEHGMEYAIAIAKHFANGDDTRRFLHNLSYIYSTKNTGCVILAFTTQIFQIWLISRKKMRISWN